MVDIKTIDVQDDDTVRQLLELERAAHAADRPDGPPPCSIAFPANLRNPWPGEDSHHRVIYADGRIVGRLWVGLPTMDNLHLAYANLLVHPSYRRQGIGRALLEFGMDFARSNGRRTLGMDARYTWEDGPRRPEAGARFLESMGFSLALTEVIRRTDLTALDPAVEEDLYSQALARSSDYETIAWNGRSPEELLDGQARLESSFVDEAPMGDLDIEPEKFDADRVRRNQDGAIARGMLMCGVTVRHIPTGEIVADTLIGVNAEHGGHGFQWGTLVAPGHRGHRLGMRIKIENHRQLRKHQPDVRYVWTGNADVNAYMISINEALGFRPVDCSREYQRAL